MAAAQIKRSAFEAWVRKYLACWKSNDVDEIGALFAANARYQTQAFRPPIVGRNKIVKMWLERAPWQGKWKFKYRWTAIEGNVGVLEGVTTYRAQIGTFNNIWTIKLQKDGRCSEFREQWVRKRR